MRKLAQRQYLLQVSGKAGSSLDKLEALLSETGVVLDKSYVPIDIDPNVGTIVFRGWADSQARNKAEQLGVQFFGDAPIESTKNATESPEDS